MSSGEQPMQDEEYFTSYEDLTVHELMLKDEARTKAYQRFIEDNAALFRDKVVVDVGAGTGILSMFAARAGAKQVYAIEASGVASICREIVSQNDLDERITVIQGRVEEVALPGGIQADILISEWMGFYLLHESMLESVISARDRLLKPDGVMVPATATLYLCPVSMNDFYTENFRYWTSVYGFNFSPMVAHVKQRLMSSPQIQSLTANQCLAEPEEILNLDLKFVDSDDVRKITNHAKFKLTKNGLMHGLACWFDVEFEGDVSSILSTRPQAETTHWKQTVILLPDAMLVNKGEQIQCNVQLEQSVEHPRRYNISIEVPEEEEENEEEGQHEQFPSESADMIIAAMQSGDQ